MQEKIRRKLRDIERQQDVRIIYAVESGSRAWGFASPDSDWDVRYIYVRRPEDYLRVDSIRDTIEGPLDDVLDEPFADGVERIAHRLPGDAGMGAGAGGHPGLFQRPVGHLSR